MKKLIRHVRKLAAGDEVRQDTELRTRVHKRVHDGSSTASTKHCAPAVEFAKKSIVFTGGGTAGHVTPNLALIEALNPNEWAIAYIGSEQGIEKGMLKKINIPFFAIKTGKFRRYFSWKNFLDPFYILCGIWQSFFILGRLKAGLVFSKGGFVAFPVVVAAWLRCIPVITHESDLTPGLANRLCFPFVQKICLTFAAGAAYFKASPKIEITGTPIRQALFLGQKARGLSLCAFSSDKPCLLVMGGSLGAKSINHLIREALPSLTKTFQVIHLCGKGHVDLTLKKTPHYCQWEYVNDELPDLLAAADLVISRAGSNSVYELLALQKPHLFIPLSAKASRGDQLLNAAYFEKQKISVVLLEENLSVKNLLLAIDEVSARETEVLSLMRTLAIQSGTPQIIRLINEACHHSLR